VKIRVEFPIGDRLLIVDYNLDPDYAPWDLLWPNAVRTATSALQHAYREDLQARMRGVEHNHFWQRDGWAIASAWRQP
jgi:hypothetical protein